jgi:Cthe_2314-like HEPN
MNDEAELLNDRVRFKLIAASRHLNELKEIKRVHGNINKLRLQSEMEMDCFLAHIIGAKDALLVEINNKLNLHIPIEKIELKTVNKKLKRRNKEELLKYLNKISSNPKSWFWLLNEIRNHFLHRERIPRHVSVNIFENVNENTSSSTQSIHFVEISRIKDNPFIKKPIISFLEESLERMTKLVENIRKKIPAYI